MTVAANVAYGVRQRRVPGHRVKQRVEHYLSLVRMTGMADRFPRALSGGQQQRVALARALAIEPEVLLLDEPLAALDAKLRMELRVELKRLLREIGATVIVVTHDQEEAMSLGDEVVVMNDGSIEQRGTPADIYDRPATRFVAEFVGKSNWFLGRITKQGQAGSMMRTDDGFELQLAAMLEAGSSVEVCVRPERIRAGGPGGSQVGGQAVNVYEARVTEVVYLGSDINAYVEMGEGRRLLVKQQNLGTGLVEGEKVEVFFKAADCHVVPSGGPTGGRPATTTSWRNIAE
jgi:putative spermidine/putrescine transport system ATP-binding protein/putrescine transport system ATP-binding protein